jgi:hypothetical protein
MGESRFHAGVQEEIKQYILNGIQVAASTVKDKKLRKLLLSSKSLAAATIRHKKKLFNQPDFSFIQPGALFPSLVGEIAFGQTSDNVEKKARRYIRKSDGNIQAVIVVDVEYPSMRKGWVSLRVADGASGSWVQHRQLLFDDDTNERPDGQLELYISDIVGLACSPAAFCRPLTATTDSRASRFVQSPSLTGWHLIDLIVTPGSLSGLIVLGPPYA